MSEQRGSRLVLNFTFFVLFFSRMVSALHPCAQNCALSEKSMCINAMAWAMLISNEQNRHPCTLHHAQYNTKEKVMRQREQKASPFSLLQGALLSLPHKRQCVWVGRVTTSCHCRHFFYCVRGRLTVLSKQFLLHKILTGHAAPAYCCV